MGGIENESSSEIILLGDGSGCSYTLGNLRCYLSSGRDDSGESSGCSDYSVKDARGAEEPHPEQ